MADPEMVFRVDRLRIDRGELPSQMTVQTTKLAAELARAKRGEASGPGFLSGLANMWRKAGGGIESERLRQHESATGGGVLGRFLSPAMFAGDTLNRVSAPLRGAMKGNWEAGAAAIDELREGDFAGAGKQWLTRGVRENRGAAQAIQDPNSARGIDFPGVESLPDEGFSRGPLNITPRTLGGFGIEAATDMTSVGGAKPAARAAGKAAVGYRDLANRIPGAGMSIREVGGGLPDEGPAAIMQRLNSRLSELGERPVVPRGAKPPRVPAGSPPQPPQSSAPMPTSPRAGSLLGLPDEATLTSEVGHALNEKDILRVDALGRRQVSAVANRVRADAELSFAALGKTFRDVMGNVYLRDVAPSTEDIARGLTGSTKRQGAPLVAVLEHPNEYALTAAQRAAVDRLGAIPEAIKAERTAFGVGPRVVETADEDQFFWRSAKTTSKGVDTGSASRPGTPGTKLGGGKDKSRVFEDVREGLAAGVVYQHPQAAIDANVTRGLKLAVDEHVKGLLVPLSESAAARVPPALRAQHEALLTRLTGLKGTLGRLDARVRNTIDAYANAAVPDIDSLYDELAAVASRGGKTPATVAKELESVKAQINQMRPEWRRAVTLAKPIPAGRAGVSMDVAPALAGRDFDPRVAQNIEDYYRRSARIRLPGTDKSLSLRADLPIVREVSGLLTPMRATGDFSAIMINQSANIARHPLTFAKNVALGFRDLVVDAPYREWLSDPKNGNAARRGVVIAGDVGQPLELQFSNWMQRIPVLKQVNEHYTRFNNRMRVDMFNQIVDAHGGAGKVSALEQEGIARSVNRFTGVANNRATDVETLVQFAPNFTRAHIETLAKAVSDGTIEGSLAREHLATMAAAGTSLVAGAALAQGRDLEEVLQPFDLRALKRGELRMNSNFMSVRAFGQDVKVFGKYDSLMRLAIVAADSGLRAALGKDPHQLFDVLGFFTQSQGSPVTSFLSSLVQGETFSGQDPLSAKGALENFTPFTLPAVATGLNEGAQALGEGDTDKAIEKFGGAAVNIVGGKASPLSVSERVELGQFDTLDADQQLEGYRKQSWQDVAGGFGEEMTGGAGSYRQWRESQLKTLTKEFRNAGMSEAQSVKLAEDTVDKTPVAKVYGQIKNVREDQWGLEHPKEAAKLLDEESRLPEGERYFNPTNKVLAYIEAMREAPEPPKIKIPGMAEGGLFAHGEVTPLPKRKITKRVTRNGDGDWTIVEEHE